MCIYPRAEAALPPLTDTLSHFRNRESYLVNHLCRQNIYVRWVALDMLYPISSFRPS